MAGVATERVMLLRAAVPGGTSVGSGTLVGPRLVLTAAHVVFDKSSGQRAASVQVLPLNGEQTTGRVVWPDRYAQAEDPAAHRDAALVLIEDESWVPPRLGPVRWGRLTGRAPGVPCEAVGFPRALCGEDLSRDNDHVDGTVNPRSRRVAGRYDLHVTSPIPQQVAGEPSPWQGASGAGLVANGLLIGVLVVDETHYEGRLSALPVHRLAHEQTFTAALAEHGGGSLDMASAECWTYLRPVRDRPLPQCQFSPSRVLLAEHSLMGFYGRDEELDDLVAWCRSEEPFSARILVGQGGLGKTRLARELCKRLDRSALGTPWLTGLLTRQATGAEISLLADVEGPALIIIDYAEGRESQLGSLESALITRDNHNPIRVLLLARSIGQWWENCRRRNELLASSANSVRVMPVTSTPPMRLRWLTEAVSAFAPYAPSDPDALNPSDIVESIHEDDLAADAFANPLTLQMRALLLLLGDQSSAEEPMEADILSHEARYWEDMAKAHDLTLHEGSIRVAVATASLATAADLEEGLGVLRRVSTFNGESGDRLTAVAHWLRDLYPPLEHGHFWGALQPDRLAERLVAEVMAERPSWLREIISDATEEAKAYALDFLARARAHHPVVAAQMEELLVTQQKAMEPIVVAGLLRRAKKSPQSEKTEPSLEATVTSYADYVQNPVELR